MFLTLSVVDFELSQDTKLTSFSMALLSLNNNPVDSSEAINQAEAMSIEDHVAFISLTQNQICRLNYRHKGGFDPVRNFGVERNQGRVDGIVTTIPGWLHSSSRRREWSIATWCILYIPSSRGSCLAYFGVCGNDSKNRWESYGRGGKSAREKSGISVLRRPNASLRMTRSYHLNEKVMAALVFRGTSHFLVVAVTNSHFVDTFNAAKCLE